jgi:hypothetical protein
LIFTGPGALAGGDVIVKVFAELTFAVPRFAPYHTSGVNEKAFPKPPEVVPPLNGPK